MSKSRDEMIDFIEGVAEIDYEAAESYMQVVIDGSVVDEDEGDDYPDVEDGRWQEQYIDVLAEGIASKTEKEVAADYYDEVLDAIERIKSNLLLIQKYLEHKKLLLTTHS